MTQILYGFAFDPDRLRAVAAGLQPLLDAIDSDRTNIPLDAEARLLHWVRIRMSRYRVRLAGEFGVTEETDIDQMFESVLSDVFTACRVLLHQSSKITWDDLSHLHTRIYPKGLWGPARNARGEEMLIQFPTGVFRQHEEFVKSPDGDFYFISPPEISDALVQFDALLGDEYPDVHFLIRLIVYLAGASLAHPYYNGNGTVLYFYMGLLLLRNGYPIPDAVDHYFNHPQLRQDLTACYAGQYETICRIFLESFIITQRGNLEGVACP